MKAIVCENYGALKELQYKDVDDPQVQDNDVLVQIKAAGINFPDALVVQGLYQDKPPLPFIPGVEFAGDVLALGQAVKGVSIGDRVVGISASYGAYAEKIASPSSNIMPIPDDMSYNEAANLFCAYGTAHHALKQRAQLKKDETLLVLGAAGGTGLAAVQIGKIMGARVIAACSTSEKLAFAKSYGADELINYQEQDLKATLKQLTQGKGVDVVYDPVGGDAFNAATRCMARGGRLLVVGFASGTIPQFPVNLSLVKEYSVVGVFWGSFTRHEPKVFAENTRELFSWYQQKKVHIITDSEYKLSEAAMALARIFDRNIKGKIVLKPEPG
ncbi:Quinone oxidoreductase 1 [Thalassocella blandensis]|nr:Quinone oxidoreductase 1 [Thalassocella blandensis]